MRPTRDEVAMEMAHTISKLGTCDRLRVGAVIHRQGRIIVTGYNGVPAGLPHCDHASEEPPAVGEDRGCQRAVHAEANTIAFAAKYGLQIGGADLTVTHMPCLACAVLIVNAGIISVTFQQPYRKLEGIELLTRARVRVVQLD